MSNQQVDREALEAKLASLVEEHRDLDKAIAGLERSNPGDSLTLNRLKKKKLQLKDQIILLENELLPDIIA